MSLIKILSDAWGSITLQNTQNQEVKTFRDCKISPNGFNEWDWKESGTRHFPGIQINDIDEFIPFFQPRDLVILTKGRCNKLQISPSLQDFINKQNMVDFYIDNTEQGIEKYKENYLRRRVYALIHTTC